MEESWAAKYDTELRALFDGAAKARVQTVMREVSGGDGAFYTYEDACRFMLSPQELLDGGVPFDMAVAGEESGKRVLNAVGQWKDCSYI